MRKTLLLVPLFAAACSTPKFQASKVVELDLPLEQAQLLHCQTHNGRITVSRGEASDRVLVRAELSARGFTQEEADDNLTMLSVGHEHDGDTLRLFGEYPKAELRNRSPRFSFDVQVPAELALALVSHNGDVDSEGVRGPLAIETHNGDITAGGAGARCEFISHNGDIRGDLDTLEADVVTHNGNVHLSLAGSGALRGKVVTHNGDIEVAVEEAATGWLDAHTHNGRISPPRVVRNATVKKRSLRCLLGEAETDGSLRLETHNGSIRIDHGEPRGDAGRDVK